MPQGTIVARAYTSNAIIPVEDAFVRIVRHAADGSTVLLGEQRTNANGLTQPLTVDTPSAAESQSPGVVHPFAEVDLYCEHPLYERIYVERVQVFAGIESVQNLVMVPLQAYQDDLDQTEIFEISPQNL